MADVKDGVVVSNEKPASIHLKSIYVREIDGAAERTFRKSDENFFACVFITDGKLTIRTRDAATFELQENECVFIWECDLEAWVNTRETATYMWVYFTANNFNFPMRQILRLERAEEIHDSIKECIALLKDETVLKRMRADLIFSNTILNIFETLNLKTTNTNLHWSNISMSVDYIKDHINENLDVSILATMFGLSLKQYRKFFKRYFEVYPAEFIRKQRLLKVKEYLQYSNLTLYEISEKMDYGSPYNLSHSFKKEFGLSPIKYKKQFLEEK